MRRRNRCLVPNGDFRAIAKYAKPLYDEIVLNGLPAVLGPVAQESVVDSALLRSFFRPFKPAFLYTKCTQQFAKSEDQLDFPECPLEGAGSISSVQPKNTENWCGVRKDCNFRQGSQEGRT